MEYTNGDIESEEVNLDVFRRFIGFMLLNKDLSPVTANVRIKTMRAFIRYCYMESWIEEPIHERFKPIKTQEDTLKSFTPNEIKTLINTIDDSTFRGFRDLVIVYVLLDTMVRCSELIKMKRENVDFNNGIIQLEAHEPKTKRARFVPLSSNTVKLSKEYIEETSDFQADRLFLTYEGQPLADNTIRKKSSRMG